MAFSELEARKTLKCIGQGKKLTLKNVLSFLEVSHPSQSDVEQPPPPVTHSRPFFYVQPPSQPYFMYQWPMDPFGQYAFPGPGKKSLLSLSSTCLQKLFLMFFHFLSLSVPVRASLYASVSVYAVSWLRGPTCTHAADGLQKDRPALSSCCLL